MADREKLIKLLGGDMCKDVCCYDCEYEDNDNGCIEHIKQNMADHLLANGVTFQKWIPVSERLPEVGDRCLCNVRSFAFPGSFYQAILKYEKFGFVEGCIYTDDVTHWMPLPGPPKEE